MERQKHSESSIINVLCYDRGIYLKRNQGTYKFPNMTPEAIAKRICSDFSIEIGDIATTDIKISKSFIGINLYKIIQTAYTIASEKNGKKYITYFAGEKLIVKEKKLNKNTLAITSGVDLMSVSTTESITNMINQVVIYNDENKLISTQKDADAIKKYGLFQSYLKQDEDIDNIEKAKKIIEDNGVSQKITVENLGNIEHITGNTVIVKEPYTGVYGLFFIDNDIHTWKNGQYYNKLVLNFRNIMDEQSVASVISTSSNKTTSSDKTYSPFEYLYLRGGEPNE